MRARSPTICSIKHSGIRLFESTSGYANPLHLATFHHWSSSSSLLGAVYPEPHSSVSHLGARVAIPCPIFSASPRTTPSAMSASRRHRDVVFDSDSYPGHGFPLYQLLTNDTASLGQRMKGAYDFVLCETKADEIDINMTWPGYDEVSTKKLHIYHSSAPISRMCLAVDVAYMISRFMQKLARSPLTQPYESQWQVSIGCVHFDNVWITRLVHVAGTAWQADLFLDNTH